MKRKYSVICGCFCLFVCFYFDSAGYKFKPQIWILQNLEHTIWIIETEFPSPMCNLGRLQSNESFSQRCNSLRSFRLLVFDLTAIAHKSENMFHTQMHNNGYNMWRITTKGTYWKMLIFQNQKVNYWHTWQVSDSHHLHDYRPRQSKLVRYVNSLPSGYEKLTFSNDYYTSKPDESFQGFTNWLQT